MAKEEKSFEDLVAEAPAAPAEGAVSLVGTLARSSDPQKFVLTLQDGRSVTLETSAVKDHSVVGTSLGRTIVRVEIEAGKATTAAVPPPIPVTGFADVGENTGYRDIQTTPLFDQKPIYEGTGVADQTTGYYLDQKSPLLDTGIGDQKDPVIDTGIFDLKDPNLDTGVFDPVDTGLDDTLSGASDTYPGGIGADTAFYHDNLPDELSARYAMGGRGVAARPVSRLKGSPVVDKPPHNDQIKPVWDASKPARDQAKSPFQDYGTGAVDIGWGTGYWGDTTMGPSDLW